MKSDSLFYQIFQKLPELLGQLLGDTTTDNYSFHSVEVKGLARRIDGLFLPAIDKPQYPIYFSGQDPRHNRANRQRHTLQISPTQPRGTKSHV